MEHYIIQKEFEITYVKEFSMDCNERNYMVIYGTHIDGGFFCIPNWEVGGKLSSHFTEDIHSNSIYIGQALQDEETGKQLAAAIADIESKKEKN